MISLLQESKTLRGWRTAATSVLLGVAAWLAPAGAAHAITIDNTGLWNGTNSIAAFGESNTATYGQTITAPAGSISLTSWTFYMDDNLNPDFVDFEAYVYAWDSVLNRATGAALYSSGPYSSTNNGGAGGMEAFTINTGGVGMTAGSQYVLFFSASNLFDGQLGTSQWGTVYPGAALPDTSPGGNFVFLNNASNFGLLTTNTWSSRQGDLAFSASFAVPEPTSGSMILMGMLGLLVADKRVNRKPSG